MINSVSTRAMPTSTWLGGDCWVPRALRRKERTMIILVKLVIITSREGSNASMANSSRTSNIPLPSSATPLPRSTEKVAAWTVKVPHTARRSATAAKEIKKRAVSFFSFVPSGAYSRESPE